MSRQPEQQQDYKQLLSKAMKLCSRQEKCVSEVESKLESWGAIPETIASVIEVLKKEGFLSEERFVRYYIRDKIRFGKWGRIKILYMLRSKKVDAEILKSAIEETDEEEYIAMIEEELKKKKKSVKAKSNYEMKGKLFAFSQSRGYENDIALRIIETLVL